MQDFFSRLDNFMKNKGLNDNKITVEAGIANGIIGKARKRGSLSQDNISKILLRYPDLDANWLFTGKSDISHPSPNNDPIIGGLDDTCKGCKEKYERIEELKDYVKLLKEKIASLEKGSDCKNSPYSKTA